jgi:hypothetical protein
MPSKETYDSLPVDLAGAIARAGGDVTLPERQFEDGVRDAIAERGGYLDGWDFTRKGWCATLLFPERKQFYGAELAVALAGAWCG